MRAIGRSANPGGMEKPGDHSDPCDESGDIVARCVDLIPVTPDLMPPKDEKTLPEAPADGAAQAAPGLGRGPRRKVCARSPPLRLVRAQRPKQRDRAEGSC